MTNQELLKAYSSYLPHGVKAVIGNVRCNIAYLSSKKIAIIRKDGMGEIEKYKWEYLQENRIKLVLRPLSDLTKEIVHNGEKFVPLIKMGLPNKTRVYNDITYIIKKGHTPYIEMQKLLEWHFDVFELIGTYAINLNEIK